MKKFNILFSLFISAFLFYSCTEKKDLIIVNESLSHTVERVDKEDERVSGVWDQGVAFILNNYNRTIYLESVDYSSSHYGAYTPQKKSISPNGITPIDVSVDYYFEEPPSTISVSSRSGKTTRWYLHD